MAHLYILKQVNRTYKDGRRDPANGKWYAHAVYAGTRNTNDLAERISYSTTVTKADCLAVLSALAREFNDAFENSQSIKLDGIGTFKIGLHSKGALEAEDFSVTNNITGIRVNFMPEYSRDIATSKKDCPMTKNIKLKETAKNAVGVVTD